MRPNGGAYGTPFSGQTPIGLLMAELCGRACVPEQVPMVTKCDVDDALCLCNSRNRLNDAIQPCVVYKCKGGQADVFFNKTTERCNDIWTSHQRTEETPNVEAHVVANLPEQHEPSPSAQTTPSGLQPEASSPSTAVIVGAVLGSAAGLALICGLLFWLCSRRRTNRLPETRPPAESPIIDPTFRGLHRHSNPSSQGVQSPDGTLPVYTPSDSHRPEMHCDNISPAQELAGSGISELYSPQGETHKQILWCKGEEDRPADPATQNISKSAAGWV